MVCLSALDGNDDFDFVKVIGCWFGPQMGNEKMTISRKKFLWREGAREADRLLEEHKGAEAEAKKLKTGMDSSVCSSVGDGGVHCSAGEKINVLLFTNKKS